jgi:Tol biopolymer transport system component
MPLAQGSHVGNYEILGPLGAGGMGEVYRARDVNLARDVALKFVPAEFANDREWRRRFTREARLLASLSHVNIATVYRYEGDHTPPFLVMELVPGETLAERLSLRPIALEDALDILRQIAAGLEFAHDAGIVHRDLKPSNVKVLPDGSVKILDFGLAKSLRDGSDPALLTTVTSLETAEGRVMGTAPYMSPEQARGKAVDQRSDIWAFGCVAYEMLCRQRAFPGETATDTIASILRAEPDWRTLPSGTPNRLQDLLRRCLRKEPARRQRDAHDVRVEIEDMQAFAAALPAVADATATTTPAASAGRRRGRSEIAAWSLAAAATALAVWLSLSFHRSAADAPRFQQFSRLTDQVGEENEPTISPDGKSIAYTSRARGSWDIYVQRVGGHNPIVVAGDSARDERAPAFSPDGGAIAFHDAAAGGGIFVVGATGENARRLTDFGFHPAWSPDGRRLVFCTEAVVSAGARFTKSALWVVDATGGAPTKLFDGDAVQPAWSPSGARIAFFTATGDTRQRDIHTIDSTGGSELAVTNDAALDWTPAWSPDGRWLYFASDRGGSMGIWRVAIDEKSGRPSGSPEPVTNGVIAAAEQPTLSKDGTRLVFRALLSSANPIAVAFDPVTETLGDVRPLTELTGILHVTDASRDGQSIALSNQGEAQEDLFIARSDGTELRRLTDDAARDRSPTWSPDGSRLTFYSNREGKGYQVWTIKTDGSGLTQVSDLPGALSFPAYSRGGDRIFVSDLVGRRVYSLDLSRPLPIKAADEVIGARVGDGYVSLQHASPDGRLIAGPLLTAGRPVRIGVYDVRAQKSRKVSDRAVSAMAWLPDSRRLVLIDPKIGFVVVDVVTGAERVLGGVRNSSVEIFAVTGTSPDGKTLFANARRLESDIWMAQGR